MATSSRDRISVDLQGLKTALVSRADAMGVSPSDVVRILLVDALAVQPVNRRADVQRGSRRSISGDQRVSLRMDRAHVLALIEAAHRSGLSQGAYVAGLLDGMAALAGQGDRPGALAALTASNAELADLSRDIRHLTSLLARGEGQAARVYRARLDVVASEVRAHLRLASQALAALQPQRQSGVKDASARG